MFAGKTYTLPTIRNYHEAHKYFEGRPKPPRSTKWGEHQRPLKDTRSYHYRIERHEDGDFYDLVLYQTTMARYHKPHEDGTHRKEYQNHDSQTSRSFLWDVADVGGLQPVTDTEGVQRIMPIHYRSMPGYQFSVDAWFSPSGKLMVDKSVHTRHFRVVSSAEDKATRKMYRQMFDPLLTLVALQLPVFEANLKWDYDTAGAFQSASLSFSARQALNEMAKRVRAGQEMHQEGIEAFMEMGQRVFNKIASDRADKLGILTWHHTPDSYDAIEPVTEADLTKALWNKFQGEYLGLAGRSGYVEYPQFPRPEEIVRSNITTRNPNL